MDEYNNFFLLVVNLHRELVVSFYCKSTQGKESKAELIYDRVKLEEEIKKLVKDKKVEDIQVFNKIEGFYEYFYLLGVVYSTSEGERPLQVIWGKSESTFLDIEEEIW